MSKKAKYNPAHEAEKLDSEVRMDGEGEDPIVKALLSEEFIKGSDTQVAPIAMALAEMLTGMKMQQKQQEAIMKRFEKLEKAQKAWENDKQKFLEDVDRRASSLLTDNPQLRDKYKAEWMQTQQEARVMAQAQLATSKIQFRALLEAEPKEIVMSPGIMETVREGDNLVPRIIPEVIAIKGEKFVLQPGVPTEVPHTVALRFKEIQNMRKAIEARKNLLKDGVNEASEVTAKWNDINRKFNTGGEDMIAPSA